jgi:hypothetical protein
LFLGGSSRMGGGGRIVMTKAAKDLNPGGA